MSVALYVEGGGDDKDLKSECRRGFAKLLANMGFKGRLPKIVACGPRNDAYDDFRTALGQGLRHPIMLIDSEDLVNETNAPNNPSGAWNHLTACDKWQRPKAASDDQAQLMVTTMETWLVADPNALIKHFPSMNSTKLPDDNNLESRTKEDILAALKRATSSSNKGEYKKGRDSFDLLGKLNPDELKSKLPHFRRFVESLDARL